MNCREAKELIHGFADNELGLVLTLQMEHHIHQCPQCSGIHERLRADRSAVSDNSLYFRPPVGLEDLVASGSTASEQRGRPRMDNLGS